MDSANKPRVRIGSGQPLPDMGGGGEPRVDISEITQSIENISKIYDERHQFLSMQLGKGFTVLSNTFNQALDMLQNKPSGETERRRNPEAEGSTKSESSSKSKDDASEGLKRAQLELDVEKLRKELKESSFLRNPFSGFVSRAKYNSMMSEENKEDIDELRLIAKDKERPELERLKAEQEILKIEKTKEEQYEARNSNKELIKTLEDLNSNILKGAGKAVAAGGIGGLLGMLIKPELAISALAYAIESVYGIFEMVTGLIEGDFSKAFEGFKTNILSAVTAIGVLSFAISTILSPIAKLFALFKVAKAILGFTGGRAVAGSIAASTVAAGAAGAAARTTGGAAKSIGGRLLAASGAGAIAGAAGSRMRKGAGRFKRNPTELARERASNPNRSTSRLAKLGKVVKGRRAVVAMTAATVVSALAPMLMGGSGDNDNKAIEIAEPELTKEEKEIKRYQNLETDSENAARGMINRSPIFSPPSSLEFTPVGSTNNTSKFNNTQAQVSGAKPSTIVANGGSSSVVNNSPSTTNNYINNYAGTNDLYKDLTLRNV